MLVMIDEDGQRYLNFDQFSYSDTNKLLLPINFLFGETENQQNSTNLTSTKQKKSELRSKIHITFYKLLHIF